MKMIIKRVDERRFLEIIKTMRNVTTIELGNSLRNLKLMNTTHIAFTDGGVMTYITDVEDVYYDAFDEAINNQDCFVRSSKTYIDHKDRINKVLEYTKHDTSDEAFPQINESIMT